jgi:hypothetical protein
LTAFGSQLAVSEPEFDHFDVVTGTVRPDTSDIGTLTVGQGAVVGCPHFEFNLIYGFIGTRSSGNFGSYSPSGLTGGKTVGAIYDVEPGTCEGSKSALVVTGFSSNPGSTWLTSITCNGVENLGSGASFSYAAGGASWTWSQLFGLSSENGSNVSCTISHS